MRLKVEPDVVALAPGDVTDLLVRVHNDGEDTCTPYLQVRGVDPADVLLPDEVVAVPAGSVMTAVVRVRAAADAIPGDQRIAIAAEDLDGSQGAVSATTVLRIGARPDVAVEVDPVASVGRRGAKARTVLRNRSDRRLQVELEGRSEGVLVSFRPSRVTLDPGETKRVPTRMRRAQRSWFGEIRHGAVITARGIGAPASTTATFTQKPSVPRPAVRAVAALTALAVWVAATVVVFNRINAEPEAGPDTGVIAGPAAPGPGRTSATGMFEEEADDGVRLPVVIQGTIEGPRDPSGTTVTAERIGFGDRGTTTGLTKVVALAEVKLPRGNVLDVVRTTTDERGRFRIASGLVEEAFYRVTAVRAGFEVGSFIVSTSADQPEVTLVIALEPATGSLAGAVTDATGAPVGGATVVVTDGSAEYTTVTPSEGDDVGRWVLEGLATPATYQVLVSRRGFAAQTLIVELDGGQALRGVDAVLTADLGTIVGRITDANPDPNQPGVAQGVGALTVTLAGPEARETRTLTVAGDLRGTFDLPGLPFGDYSITFSGDGWETRQAEVTVDRGLVRLDATVNRSTGLVQGWVWQVATGTGAFQGACRYPRIDQRTLDEVTEAGTRPRPCGGVAVSVESDEGDVFATATASETGFFQIGGVPAGEYTLTLSRPGYLSDVRSIVVRPGGTFDLNPARTAAVLSVTDAVEGADFVALVLAPAPAVCAGSVLLTLIDFRDGIGIDPVTDASAPGVVTVSNAGECDPALSISRIGASGTYLLQNVPLGPQTITVGGAPSVWPYQPVTINAQVSPLDRVAVSQNILPRPRTLKLPAGTIRLEGPTGVTRSVVVEVIDSAGANVGPSGGTVVSVSGNGVNAEVDVELVGPARGLRLRAVGEGSPARGYETVTSGTFDLPAGIEPFALPLLAGPDESLTEPRLSLVATTEVTGRIFGFSALPLALAALPGATVTFPAGSRPEAEDGTALSVTTADDGTFTATVRAGTYLEGVTAARASGAFGAITVSATGYETRVFNPAAVPPDDPVPLSLSAPTSVLRGVGTDFFLLYGDPDRAAGDIGLDPSVRSVTIPVRLLGGADVSRNVTATLEAGSVPLTPAVATVPPDVTSGPLTLTVGPGGSSIDGNLQFTGVPVGTYQLRITGDDVVEQLITGIEVPPGDPAVTYSVPGGVREVQASTRLTLTVRGGFPNVVDLVDATVTFPAGTLLEGGTSADVVTFDRSVTVTVKAGTYGTSGTTFGPVEVERAGFITDTITDTDSSVALTLANPLTPLTPFETTVTLDPAPRDLSGTVELTVVGGASVSRAGLTAQLFRLAGVAGVRVAPAVVIDAGALFDSSGSFVFNGVPVGYYELEISGTGIEQSAPSAITVFSGTGIEDLGATTVRATTEVTGIVRDELDDDSTDTFVGLKGRTVRVKGGGVSGDATSTTDASGAFSLTVTAGVYSAADAFVEAGGGYAQVGMGPVGMETVNFTATSVDVGVLVPAPTRETFRLTGTVVSDPGSPVQAIVATQESPPSNTRNAVLDATTPAGSPGSYVLDGLNYGTVWRIEFRATGGAVLATRWVYLADPETADLTTKVMNQDVRSGSFADLVVEVSGPADAPLASCDGVAVTLTEDGPFPSISRTGSLVRSGAAAFAFDDDDDTCSTTFVVLRRTTDERTDPSLPANRFSVAVTGTPDGYAPPPGSPTDVSDTELAGGHTVPLELTTPDVDVEVQVTNPGTEVTDATVVATRGSDPVETIAFSKKTGTTNVYTAKLTPGGDPWNIRISREGNATRTAPLTVTPRSGPQAVSRTIPPLRVVFDPAPTGAVLTGSVSITVRVEDPGLSDPATFGAAEPFTLTGGTIALVASSGTPSGGCSATLSVTEQTSGSVTLSDCQVTGSTGSVELRGRLSVGALQRQSPETVVANVGPPGTPGVTVTPGAGQIQVSWTVPDAGSGGGVISGYRVRLVTSSGVAIEETFPVGTTANLFTGLTNGINYTVQVEAENQGGVGPAGTAVASPSEAQTAGLGGFGAIMRGTFTLTGGETLKLLAGSMGGDSTSGCNAGGGGGSFVWRATGNELLIAAGGGGGAGATVTNPGQHGTTGPDGTTGSGTSATNNVAEAGTNGNGGNAGGAGWLTDGDVSRVNTGSGTSTAPRRPLNGGAGSTRINGGTRGTNAPSPIRTGIGGFGGGATGMGEPCSNFGAGGGGGYSGGASYFGNGSGGGGGGSLNAGTAQNNSSGSAGNNGPGKVVIKQGDTVVRELDGPATASSTGSIIDWVVPSGGGEFVIEVYGARGGNRG